MTNDKLDNMESKLSKSLKDINLRLSNQFEEIKNQNYKCQMLIISFHTILKKLNQNYKCPIQPSKNNLKA